MTFILIFHQFLCVHVISIIPISSFWLFLWSQKNLSLTIINFWVGVYSKSEYEYLTWINLIWVRINSLSIPMVNRSPFRIILPISFRDIRQYVTGLHQIVSHESSSIWKWSQSRSHPKLIASRFIQNQKLIELNSIRRQWSSFKWYLPNTIHSFSLLLIENRIDEVHGSEW
jgi:hypothetical protein